MPEKEPTNAQERPLCYQLLKSARRQAAEAHGYDSKKTRKKMKRRFKKIHTGEPYEWQLDVGEAVKVGLNVTLVAGTGAGKTIPFILPLLADETGRQMCLIISPLKELQKDMV
jgi:ATP-dependent helicase YprA (DUF1998 family)